MSENERTSDDGTIISEDRARAVETLGRLAGAALRSPAPAHGAAAIQRRAHRRRVGSALAATAAVGALIVTGLIVLKQRDGSGEQQPVDTVTNTNSTTPESTTPDSTTPESTTPDSNASARPLVVVEAGTLESYPWSSYSPDGSLLAVLSRTSNVLILDSATLTQVSELPCPTKLESLPESVGTGGQPDWLWDVAAAARWDAETLSVFQSSHGSSDRELCGVSVSSDGSRAVSAADVFDPQQAYPYRQEEEPSDRRQLLWDTSDGSLVAVIPGGWVGFSADGSRMVMADGPGSFSLRDTATGTVVTTIADDAWETVSSPHGRRMLMWTRSINADATAAAATIYDMQTLTPVATLATGSADEVLDIADAVFDDTSSRIATYDVSGVTIWDASTGTKLLHIPIEFDFSQFEGWGVALSPGGAMLAVPQESHIMIFDALSGVQLADLELERWIYRHSVRFSADGSSLVAAVEVEADVSAVRVWFYSRVD